jgi:hypothetical protein
MFSFVLLNWVSSEDVMQPAHTRNSESAAEE